MSALRLRDVAVFVIHGPGLDERRERLQRELAQHGLSPQWVTDPDARTMTPDVVRRYYRASRRLWRRRTAATQRIPFRPLTPREIAVTISHVETFARIAAGDAAWGLILEDDVLLDPEFGRLFDEYFSELPDDAELVFIGSCCGLGISSASPEQHFYRKDHPATKCSDSYLVRRDIAAELHRELVPFVLTSDWELNYHLKKRHRIVYWLEPPLAVQGSEAGVYASSQR